MTQRTIATFAAAAALLLVAGAAPARADHELRNGFEDQTGRLLAVEAFRLGHVVLSHAFYPHGPVVVVRRPVVVHRHGPRCGHRGWQRHGHLRHGRHHARREAFADRHHGRHRGDRHRGEHDRYAWRD